jgi:surface antigen
MQAHDGPKQTGGTLIGAGLGALAGFQIGQGRGRLAAVAIGALAGAALGNEVGQSLDRADRLHISSATKSAHQAPIGKRIKWKTQIPAVSAASPPHVKVATNRPMRGAANFRTS